MQKTKQKLQFSKTAASLSQEKKEKKGGGGGTKARGEIPNNFFCTSIMEVLLYIHAS